MKIPIIVKPFTLSGEHEMKSALNSDCQSNQHSFFLKNKHWAPIIEKKRYYFPWERAIIYESLGQSFASDLCLLGVKSNQIDDFIFSCKFEQIYYQKKTGRSLGTVFPFAKISNLKTKRYKKNRNIKSILFGLPPNQFNRLDVYLEFIKKIYSIFSEICSKKQISFITKPHPRVFLDKKALKAVRQLSKISCKSIEEEIRKCDLYICSASTSCMYAITAGIPCINFDVFKYGYNDFKDIPGVFNVTTWLEFQTTLFKICSDPSYFKSARENINKFIKTKKW